MSLELLVAVPILLLCIMSTVQFGLQMAGAVLVHQAAVVGAARCSTLARGDAASLINDTETAVVDQLAAAGITFGPGYQQADNLQVVVQEKVDNAGNPAYVGTASESGFNFVAVPANAGDIPFDSVLVMVNVEVTGVAPDLLTSLGFSILGRYVTASAVRPFNGP